MTGFRILLAGLLLAVDYPAVVRTLCIWGAEARILPEERGYWPHMMDTSTWTDSAIERFVQAQGPQNWPGLFERMLAGYVRVLEQGGNIVADRLDRILVLEAGVVAVVLPRERREEGFG